MPAHMLHKPRKGAATKAKRARAAAKLQRYRAVCRAVDARDGRRCRVCGSRNGIEHHHLVKRSQGGPDTTANLLTLCAWCHADVHHAKIRLSGDADGHVRVERDA